MPRLGLTILLAPLIALLSAFQARDAARGAAPPRAPAPVPSLHLDETDPDTGFARNAFPPTLTDTESHEDAWLKDDCLRCHELGVGEAQVVRHRGMGEILLLAKCRSCHVLEPGKVLPTVKKQTEPSFFADNAFPPMIPDSESHLGAWTIGDCLMCHEEGVGDAPITKHADMPRLLLKAKCRTCHVQIRSHQVDPWKRQDDVPAG